MRVAVVVLAGVMAGVLGILGRDLGLRDWVLVSQEDNAPTPTMELPKSKPKRVLGLSYKENETSVAWIEIKDLDTVSLLPNFTDKFTLKEIVDSDRCRQAVSGGFYIKEADVLSPLGFFVSEGTHLSAQVQNSTMNGYFVIARDGMAILKPVLEEPAPRVGLQTGPLLVLEGQPQELKLKNDKASRRVILALTDEKSLIFAVFYNSKSKFTGPYLVDLPQLTFQLAQEIDKSFDSAVNLDGGAASAFYNDEVVLSEASPVGSYFCIN